MQRAPLSLRVSRVLGVLEERARVRLHQAANRMEDADPLAVGVARASVRVFDGVDRLTGFRERDARARSR